MGASCNEQNKLEPNGKWVDSIMKLFSLICFTITHLLGLYRNRYHFDQFPGCSNRWKCGSPTWSILKMKDQDIFDWGFGHSSKIQREFVANSIRLCWKMWTAGSHTSSFSWLWRQWWREQGHVRMAQCYFFVCKDQRTDSVRVQAEGGLTVSVYPGAFGLNYVIPLKRRWMMSVCLLAKVATQRSCIM